MRDLGSPLRLELSDLEAIIQRAIAACRQEGREQNVL